MSHDDLGAEAHIGSKPEWSDRPAKRPIPRETEMIGWMLFILSLTLVAAAAILVVALY
jgi:hypothetical protein